VRYESLSALACTEAASPGRAPSRFQRDEQVVELRLEKVAAGTVAMVHDVTAEVRHQDKLQRDREALLHERRDRPTHPVDVAAVLNGAVEMARSEADLAGVGIDADVPPLPLVRGSAAELAHVFGSLLLHAREETPEGGAVRVSARQGRGQVCVSISDGGPGLSDEDAARIFDPFSGVGARRRSGFPSRGA
jgi:signal transduction histidine kinase